MGFHVQQASGEAGAALLHVFVQRGQPPELTYPGYEPCDHPAYRVVRAADEFGGLRATFAAIDRNNNGYIEWRDIEATCGASPELCRGAGHAEPPELLPEDRYSAPLAATS